MDGRRADGPAVVQAGGGGGVGRAARVDQPGAGSNTAPPARGRLARPCTALCCSTAHSPPFAGVPLFMHRLSLWFRCSYSARSENRLALYVEMPPFLVDPLSIHRLSLRLHCSVTALLAIPCPIAQMERSICHKSNGTRPPGLKALCTSWCANFECTQRPMCCPLLGARYHGIRDRLG